MEQTLDKKISDLNSFFNYFYLNKENFSKNIQLQLNLLKPLIKFEKGFLSTIEKEKLIFIQSENMNNIMRLNNDEDKNGLKEMKILDLLYSIVKRFNMDLKYNKEKMHNNYKSNEIDFEKTFKDINYDILLKTYEEKFGNISKNIFNTSKNEKNNYISNKDILKNKEIDLILYDLKKKLNNYKDLPTEINQMRNLVEIKKEEYKSLLMDKKQKNA